MPISELSVFDPPLPNAIRIQITLTNTGDRAGTFYVQGVTGIVEGAVSSITDIDIADVSYPLLALAADFDSIVNAGFSNGGLAGIINVEAGQSVTIRFDTEVINQVGFFDLGFQTGIYNAETGAFENLQDTLIVEDIFEMYVPPTGELSDLEFIGTV
ncbi:hypothetical protein [Orenia marismortui]|uniref:Uncharacterized protein n=1 Tax=Orenia marismortui TaxID=46469 RepID=A0A4R8H313_9FIRM|nr:hypothetical protein [Orenia marismortui]TDX48834.1 hypothetical protein C7959_12513 [Orenia marismortui]